MADYPLLVLVLSLLVLWMSAQAGSYRRRHGKLDEDARADLGVVLSATLTLLGLVIGFAFSMAIGRYDQRKSCEAAEANAIGTEFVRTGLLTGTEPSHLRGLLRDYRDQRELFYTTRNGRDLQQIDATTTQQQADLWAAIQALAATQPPALVGLNVAGMNDVLNTAAYTQAAWWNRVPPAAWALMAAIAICCNFLIGFTARRQEARMKRFFALPLIVSIAFFLIADIDSPRGGLIRVHPQNLESLSLTLRGE